MDLLDAYESEDARLDELVHGWAERWRLAAEWVVELAKETTLVWTREPQAFREPRWAFPPVILHGILGDDAEQFTFTHRGWEPVLFSRTEIEDVVRDRFESSLRAYLDRIEAVAEHRGLRRIQDSREGAAHLRWLARYQVGLESMPKIAARVGRERSTIGAGIRGAAELIDLKVRAPRSGRPPKPK